MCSKQETNGKQCTIIWHVDDLKISQVEKKVVNDIIAQLNGKFHKESPLTAMGGKILEYLGMTLDYTSHNKVKISMYKYVDKMPTELPTDPPQIIYSTSTQMQRNCLRPLPNNFITWWQNYCIYQDVPDKTFKPRSHFFVRKCNRLTRMTIRNLLG